MTRFDVCVPFRGDGAERTRNWMHLRPIWEAAGLPVIEGDVGGGAAAARNALIALGSADVVVMLDADVLASPDQVREAAALAARTGGYVAAHTDLHYLTDEQTIRLIGGERMMSGDLENHHRTWFGLIAFPRVLWQEVGGFDERFGEWARFEIAFWWACKTLGGPLARVEGSAFHLWHPAREPVGLAETAALLHRYQAADGDPVAMRELLGRGVA